MEASKKSLDEIIIRSIILDIPHFQRAYVWKEEQWDRFLEDVKYVSSAGRPYFMGSVILKQQETTISSGTNAVRTVVDGQQRLTTFFLLFKALYEVNENPEVFNSICFTYTNEIILDHNYLDKPVFEKIINNQELTMEEKEKQPYKCYKYFKDNIKKGEVEPNILLSKIRFVCIELQADDDEQQIFDTINSLGVSLTTSELLKNYLFKDDINSYIENWRKVFEENDELRNYWEQEVTLGRNKRSNLDLFLQSYLFIKVYDQRIGVISEDKERFIKIDSVFNSFKELINNYKLNQNEVIKEIREFAGVYQDAINPSIENENFDKDNHISRINFVMFGLETVTMIPYILYISKYAEEDERMAILKYLETYILRRMVCRFTSKNYNQLFRSLINNRIKTLAGLKDYIDKKSDKINHMPSDEELESGFKESQLTNKQTKGILYLIEKSIHSERNATELRSPSEYSLEHVMPKKWRNKWKDNLTEEQKNDRDRLLLTLGNLTIITHQLNSAIRDSDWRTKKKGRGSKYGLNEYAAGIEIFNKNLELDCWDESAIKERAERLYKEVKDDVWPL